MGSDSQKVLAASAAVENIIHFMLPSPPMTEEKPPAAEIETNPPSVKWNSARVNRKGSKRQNVKRIQGNLSQEKLVCLPNSLLPTGVFRVGKSRFRFLLDTGSTTTFVTPRLAQILCATDLGKSVEIHTLGDGAIQTAPLKLLFLQPNVSVRACVLKSLCSVGPVSNDQRKNFPPLGEEELCDTYPRGEEQVDIVIGQDALWRVIKRVIVLKNDMAILRTIFGSVLTGVTEIGEDKEKPPSCAFSLGSKKETVTNDELNAILRQFWETEKFGVSAPSETETDQTESKSPLTLAESIAVDTFKKNISFKKGKYRTKLIKRPNVPPLKNNIKIALARFRGHEEKLKRSAEQKKVFDDAISEYMLEGDVEKVDISLAEAIEEAKASSGIFYLPFRIVSQVLKERKFRLVYDGSCASGLGGPSLNESLLPGPKSQADIMEILLHFRAHKVGLCSDVKRYFLSVRLDDEEDKNLLRFLHRDENGISIYRFKCIIFGATDSPFQSAMTLQYHLAKMRKDRPELTEAIDLIERSIYVDDLTASVKSAPKAIKLRKDVSEVLKLANFKIRKWTSNSSSVMQSIPEDDRASFELEGNEPVSQPTRVLGVRWTPKDDTLSVNTPHDCENLHSLPTTKRFLASITPRVFDPCGYLSPFTVRAKMMLQNAWMECKEEWDRVLSNEINDKWQEWLKELPSIKDFQLPRSMELPDDKKKISIECFADASKKALGVSAYLRIERSKNKYDSYLIMSRSILVPKNCDTIPRAELEALRRASRMAKYLQRIYDLPDSQVRLFSDSLIALFWAQMDYLELKTYCSNAVKEIQGANLATLYVNTKENPADLVTRGATIASLCKSSLWKNGPAFLSTAVANWPDQPIVNATTAPDAIDEFRAKALEAKLAKSNLVITKENPIVKIADRVSSYQKTLRVTSYVLRFLKRVSKDKSFKGDILHKPIPNPSDNDLVSVGEVQYAELVWVRLLQRQYFSREINILKFNDTHDSDEKQCLPSASEIVSLDPFFDKDLKVLRVGGRLEHSRDVTPDQKHQIILPRKCLMTKRLIFQVHSDNKHPGVEWTLSHVRTRFWFTKGKQTVIPVTRNCVKCRRHNQFLLQQKMSDLPDFRTSVSKAFEHVGFDIAGPTYIRMTDEKGKPMKDTEIKCYILVFRCFASHAVHFELLIGSYDTHSVLMALRRFMARRGMVKTFYCDGAPQFQSADKEIRELMQKIVQDEVFQNTLVRKNIKFEVNIPFAQHRLGGVERINNTMKKALRKQLGKSKLTETEMLTVLVEIESMMNQKPLTFVYNHANEPEVITPAHLMIGSPLQSLPAIYDAREKLPSTSNDLASRWRYRQLLLKRVWNEFHDRTTHYLQTRSKWQKPHQNVQLDDIVLIKDDNQKRNFWPIGRVVKLHPSPDGLVRGCDVRIGRSTLTGRHRDPITVLSRPIQKLVLLKPDSFFFEEPTQTVT